MPALTLDKLEALDKRLPPAPWLHATSEEKIILRVGESTPWIDYLAVSISDISMLRGILPAYIEMRRDENRWLEFVEPGKVSRVDVSVNLAAGENPADVEAAISKNFAAYRCGEPLPIGEKVGVVDFNAAPADKPYNIADLQARQENLLADMRAAETAIEAEIAAKRETLTGLTLLEMSVEQRGGELQRRARWHEATESQRHDAQLEWQIIKRVLEAAPRKPAEATPERLTNLYSAMRALEGHRGEAAARRAAERSADCD
jgi:hypothetical protein